MQLREKCLGVAISTKLRRRDASAKGRRIEEPSGVGYGRDIPFPSRLRGPGSVLSFLNRFRGRAPTGDAVCRILKSTECYFCDPAATSEATVLSVRYVHADALNSSVFRVTFWGQSLCLGLLPLILQRRTAPNAPSYPLKQSTKN